MKGPLRVLNAGTEGIRLTIGPVWADLPRADALAMWKQLGKELGLLCEEHRLGDVKTSAVRCKRCDQLVELASPPK